MGEGGRRGRGGVTEQPWGAVVEEIVIVTNRISVVKSSKESMLSQETEMMTCQLKSTPACSPVYTSGIGSMLLCPPSLLENKRGQVRCIYTKHRSYPGSHYMKYIKYQQNIGTGPILHTLTTCIIWLQK